MEQKLSEAKLQRIRFNLIPGTGLYSRVTDPNDCIEDNDEKYNSEGGIATKQIAIDIYGEVYKDTEIRIGNRSLKLRKLWPIIS